jgi:hypothetical protein
VQPIGNKVGEAGFVFAAEVADGVVGVEGAGSFAVLGLGGGSVGLEVHGVYLFSFISFPWNNYILPHFRAEVKGFLKVFAEYIEYY